MDMFLKRGFAVFIYDHRNHGLSGGSDTSYGYYEKFDLKKCTDWVFDKLGKDIMEGLHGEEDDYVPVIMCNQMYSVKNGYKEIYILLPVQVMPRLIGRIEMNMKKKLIGF